jgi:hypothetical protein
MPARIILVDHFAAVLKNCSDERLLNFTTYFVKQAQEPSATSFIHDRTNICRRECERRHISRLLQAVSSDWASSLIATQTPPTTRWSPKVKIDDLAAKLKHLFLASGPTLRG